MTFDTGVTKGVLSILTSRRCGRWCRVMRRTQVSSGEVEMAIETWVVVGQKNCDLIQQDVELREQRVYASADFLRDFAAAYRVRASSVRRRSTATWPAFPASGRSTRRLRIASSGLVHLTFLSGLHLLCRHLRTCDAPRKVQCTGSRVEPTTSAAGLCKMRKGPGDSQGLFC
jgi:hypothetical protein